MELIDLLIKNNFSAKEAKIYLTCLQLKIANASTIARISGENRSTTYSILKELKKKELVNEIDKNKISSYTAISPEHIVKKLQTQVEDFKELLPAFAAFTEKFGITPKVQFFEGLTGLEEVYTDTLSSQVDIIEFLGTKKFPKSVEKYLATTFFPLKLKKGLSTKTLISDTPQNRMLLKKEQTKKNRLGRNQKIIAGLSFPKNVIITCYGPNKVIMGSYTEKEPFGLIISSCYLYETLLSIFSFLWTQSK